MVSVKELAKELGVSSKTIYAMVESEAIPFLRIGVGRGTLRFDIAEVKESLKQKQERVTVSLERSRKRHLG